MTTIAAVMRRSYTADMFADLTAVTHTHAWDRAGVTLTFAGDLDDVTVAAIRDRMTSRDDVDQAARDGLRTKRDAVVGEDVTAQAVRAAINYLLGESP